MGILQCENWCWSISDLLDSKTIKQYALEKNWSIYDAIILSMGYKPPQLTGNEQCKRRGPVEIIEEDVYRSFCETCDLVEKFINDGDLVCFPSHFSKYEGLKPYAVNAEAFFSVLIRRGWYICTNELPKAVFDEALRRAGILTPESTLSQQAAVIDEGQLQSTKNQVFSDLGKRKGRLLREFVDKVTEYAIKEIDRGCTCSQGKLADYLGTLKTGTGSSLFPDPRPADKRKIPLRGSFVEAAGNARRQKGLLLQGEKGYVNVECLLHASRKK